MKKRTLYVVLHTTDHGADYNVGPAHNDRQSASAWEHAHRDEYPRPLIIRKVTY